SRFIIEKSTDSVNFSILDSVPAHADSNGIDNYQYTDPQLDSGNNYYRLAEVTDSGTIVYSPIRVVQGPSSGGGVGVYPNPVIRHTALYVRASTKTERIRMVDVSGREILNLQVGGTLNMIPLGNLAPGIYFIEVVTDSGTTTQKILIK
ncbi:MAG TPA: T9SS type A sorting domain-containing protein, partial [Puia sp.]|nr:T9SS type A sorting domain-containing protein [Puia sp.]